MKYRFLIVLLLCSLYALHTGAQSNPALENHIKAGIAALKNKDITSWKTLFPARSVFDQMMVELVPDQGTDATAKEFRKLEQEARWLNFESGMISLYIKQYSDYQRGDNVDVSWDNLVFKKVVYNTEEMKGIRQYNGWILAENSADQREYLLLFSNVLEYKNKFYALDMTKDRQINGKEFEQIVKQAKEEGPLAAVSDEAAPAASPVKEMTDIYSGSIGGKTIIINWNSYIYTEGSPAFNDVHYYYGDQNEEEDPMIFNINQLDDDHFVLVEEEGKGFLHLSKTGDALTGTWISNDGKIRENIVLKKVN